MSTQKTMPRGAGVRRVLKRAGGVLAVFAMICIITGCIVACTLTVSILRHMNDEEPIDFEQVKLSYTTIIYTEDASGSPQEYMEIQTGQDRTWIDYSDIPAHMRRALIAVEDKRFMDHHGVDWKRTFWACLNEVFHFRGRQGASTLTQQVVRNLTGDSEVRVDRKVREIMRALQVERDYTKEQIIEMYLNTAFFGNNAYGVQAAAETYFGKGASELTLAESASIIGITQFPAKYDPFAKPAENKKRQKKILALMLDQGKIDRGTYDAAAAEPLNFQRDAAAGKQSVQTYNYFIDHLVETVIADLQSQKGYSYEDAENLVNRGGLRIYATVDPVLQDKVSAFYSDAANFPAVNNAEYPQSAFAALAPNGRILALAGGIGDKKDSRAFNRATQAKRQSGSAIKPLAAYLAAFENDLVTWSTVMDDHPITIRQNGADMLWPVNFQGRYDGMMNIDRALRESRNTIPVKLVESIGPQRVFDVLHDKLGFSSLVPRREGQSHDDVNLSAMALGGMTYGVTPLEMAGGYQIFANGGSFTKPYCYTEVLDARGNTVLKADTAARRVIAPETATLLNKLLQRVTLPGGTGNGARWGNLPVAGKTGTATNDYDQWFMGVTPYMVTATWMGYDEPQEINYRGLAYPPPAVYHRLAAQLHEGYAFQDFPVWGKVVQKTYCTETGALASEGCTSTDIGWYAEGNLPKECPSHGAKRSVELSGKPESSEESTPRRPKLLAGRKTERPGYRQTENGLWVRDGG